MSTLQSLNKLPTLQQRVGERYQDGTPASSDGQSNGENRAIWGRIEGAHSSLKTTAHQVACNRTSIHMLCKAVLMVSSMKVTRAG